MSNLWKKEDILKVLNEEYVATGKGQVFIISTEGFPVSTGERYRGPEKSVAAWATGVVLKITDPPMDRSMIPANDPIGFAYIKFAKEENGNVVGLIGGKSRFHANNTSDINFSDHENHESSRQYLEQNKLDLYTQDVLILLNKKHNMVNAGNDEEWVQKRFGLFVNQQLNEQKSV